MKKVDTTVSRQINKRSILEKIIRNPGISRADLSRVTGLNKATISYIIEELIEAKIIDFRIEKIVTGSRKAKAIEFNGNLGLQIVIEIKRKKMRAILVNMVGKCECKIEVPIRSRVYEDVREQMIEVIERILQFNQVIPVIAIGISIAATVRLNKSINFASHFGWHNIDLRMDIESHFNIKTYLENEANLGALAEKNLYFTEIDTLININVESGVGIGMMENDGLQLGYSGFYGEFGHTTLVPNGKACSCGNRGCLELYTSEWNVMNIYRERMGNNDLKTRNFIENYHAAEPISHEVYQEFIDYFIIGIHNLLVLTNPEVIVINSRIIDGIPESIHYIKKRLVSKEVHYQDIICSKNIDTSSLIGMSQYITQKYLEIDQLRIKDFSGISFEKIPTL